MGNYYAGIMNSEAGRELRHHGILGQKWGIRRFQNPDGSLTPAGRERYGVKSTSDSSEFYKNLYNATEDPKQKNRISNFFKSGSSQAQNITRCAEEYKNASSKLDEAFVKYDKLFEKETGKAFDGDGTEAHWQFEERYPEYRKLSENEQNAKRELLKSIKDASDKGAFNGLVDISDYERRYTYNNTTTVDKNDGKAGVIGYYLAEKYGFPFFHEDLETRTFTDNKTGKKETYWPAFNERIDDVPKTGMPKASGYSVSEKEKQQFLKENYSYSENEPTAKWANSIALDNYISRNGKLPDWSSIDNALSEIDDESIRLQSRREKSDKYINKIVNDSYKMDDNGSWNSKNTPKNWTKIIDKIVEASNDKSGNTKAYNDRIDAYNAYKKAINPVKKRQLYEKYLTALSKERSTEGMGQILFTEAVQKEINKLPKEQRGQAQYYVAATYYD